MFDDVERRALLVQPAREHAFPAPPGLLDVKLHEGAGETLILPRRGRVAGPQANHGVAETDRLAGPEGDVADDPVALVEQSEHGDALGHRSHAGDRLDRLRRVDGHRIGAIGGLARIARAAAARKRGQQDQWCEAPGQDYSGFQA
jgi:hypothetical protein